ncbi:polysaccharide lyase family 1 protein [Xylariomycetidae sp. FL0641]|nr:polysaccharide lyase family 1 protein [Xylariomycetidae sp. FL0641]
MKTVQAFAATAALALLGQAAPTDSMVNKRAVSSVVNGTPLGFGARATGGGDASPVYPKNIDELKKYLTSDGPQVIVVSGTYDFTGSEGSQTEQACDNYSCNPSNGGQAMLNTLNGCPGATYDVQIDTASYNPIYVKSDKTLVGKDNAVLYGKGLRLSQVSNIIIQNIAITHLNPQYVWGGDAIAITDTSDIWIDHVTTSNLGRQHYAFGQGPSKGVTISNSFINGETDNSATCDRHTYWGIELVGGGDQITFYQNHVYMTSGRSPALSGNTLLHAVNNVWESNSGHLLEGTDDGMGLYEGNYFVNDPTVVQDGFVGHLFSSPASDLGACRSALGRDCVENLLESSGSFDQNDSSFFGQFAGAANIVSARPAGEIKSSVPAGAGNRL